MDEVWDENWFGSTKTLDVTLGRLRQKLDEASAPVRIVSVSVGEDEGAGDAEWAASASWPEAAGRMS